MTQCAHSFQQKEHPMSIADYIATQPIDRQPLITQLHEQIVMHLPAGFVAAMQYRMIGYVVPHTRYPAGYHVNPHEPLPFMALANQKHHIAVYHLGLYADRTLMEWFVARYAAFTTTKLNMGASCIRLNPKQPIPYAVIGELAGKMTVDEWIHRYESEQARR
jgi:hypothetical protein